MRWWPQVATSWPGARTHLRATVTHAAEAAQVASVEDIVKPWRLAQWEALVAYISRVADQGARTQALFTLRDVGVNDRGELANFPDIRDEPLPLLRCAAGTASIMTTTTTHAPLCGS